MTGRIVNRCFRPVAQVIHLPKPILLGDEATGLASCLNRFEQEVTEETENSSSVVSVSSCWISHSKLPRQSNRAVIGTPNHENTKMRKHGRRSDGPGV